MSEHAESDTSTGEKAIHDKSILSTLELVTLCEDLIKGDLSGLADLGPYIKARQKALNRVLLDFAAELKTKGLEGDATAIAGLSRLTEAINRVREAMATLARFTTDQNPEILKEGLKALRPAWAASAALATLLERRILAVGDDRFGMINVFNNLAKSLGAADEPEAERSSRESPVNFARAFGMVEESKDEEEATESSPSAWIVACQSFVVPLQREAGNIALGEQKDVPAFIERGKAIGNVISVLERIKRQGPKLHLKENLDSLTEALMAQERAVEECQRWATSTPTKTVPANIVIHVAAQVLADRFPKEALSKAASAYASDLKKGIANLKEISEKPATTTPVRDQFGIMITALEASLVDLDGLVAYGSGKEDVTKDQTREIVTKFESHTITADKAREAIAAIIAEESRILCPACGASNGSERGVCIKCKSALPSRVTQQQHSMQFKEGESRRTEYLLTKQMSAFFEAIDKYYKKEIPAEQLEEHIEIAARGVQDFEKYCSSFRLPEINENSSEEDKEFAKSNLELANQARANAAIGLRLCKQGLRVLRGCLEGTPTAQSLAAGQTYYFEGAQKIYQITALGEEIKRAEEERAAKKAPAAQS